MNRVVLLGRIANDLELRTASNGESYIWFTLAVNEVFNSKTTTQFIPCVSFGKTANNINQFLTKGSPLLVEGSINVRKVVTNNNQPSISVNVNVTKIHFIGNKNNDLNNNKKTSNLKEYGYDVINNNIDQNEELDVDDAIFWED